MIKKYLKSCIALLAIGTMVAGCKDDSFTQADANKHAEQVLGVPISSLQDWNMTTRLTASITINLDFDQKYTVVVYDDNPLLNQNATIYAQETAEEGKNTVFNLSVPTALKRVYVAVYDSKLRSVVQSATVSGNVLKLYFGGEAAASRRAVEADYTESYARSFDNYLNPTKARNNYGQEWDVNTLHIGIDEMMVYPILTDDLIVNGTVGGNHTLTDGVWEWSQEKGSYQAFPGGGDGKHFYIPAGTEVTEVFHVNGTYGVINDVVIYVEGKMHLNGNTLNGPTIVVGSGGEVVLDGNTNMSNTGRFVVMGGGKITGVEGVVYNVNNGGLCYNAGTIRFDGELNVNGSDVYNCGTIEVDVLRNTAGGFFTNFGKTKARTNINAADSYNSIVVNGCYMQYTENAGIGTLVMLDNSRLDVAGTAEFNQSTQTLYNNSVVNTGILYVNSTTFLGTDNPRDNAIIKTGKIYFAGDIYINQNKDDKYQNENYTQVARKIDGKGSIYLDWNNAETYTKEGVQITEDNGYTMLSVVRASNYNYISEKTSAIRIPAGECTGAGYNPIGGGGQIIVGTPAVWSYAFEDSWIADYDMNDVVVKVQKSGSAKLKITLCCTGASYPLYVYYKSTPLFGGREVHKVLGAEGKFINTGDPSNEKFAVREVVTETINKPDDFDPASFDIWIKSPEKNIHLAEQGEDPHAIMVPADWKWPLEWTPVTEAYPDFVGFAADETHETNTDWYENCDESKVYQE